MMKQVLILAANSTANSTGGDYKDAARESFRILRDVRKSLRDMPNAEDRPRAWMDWARSIMMGDDGIGPKDLYHG